LITHHSSLFTHNPSTRPPVHFPLYKYFLSQMYLVTIKQIASCQKTPNKEQQTRNHEQQTRNNEQRTTNKEQRTRNNEQRTTNKEQKKPSTKFVVAEIICKLHS
ncbi:MAG: hypothetical protein PHR79_11430, partial [Bacteroidales bacterium]|nr:hypothetical protein [Bacteroidales bacterium]